MIVTRTVTFREPGPPLTKAEIQDIPIGALRLLLLPIIAQRQYLFFAGEVVPLGGGEATTVVPG